MLGETEITDDITINVSAICKKGAEIKASYESKKIVISKNTLIQATHQDAERGSIEEAHKWYKNLFTSGSSSYSNPFTVTISMEHDGTTCTGQFKIEFDFLSE